MFTKLKSERGKKKFKLLLLDSLTFKESVQALSERLEEWEKEGYYNIKSILDPAWKEFKIVGEREETDSELNERHKKEQKIEEDFRHYISNAKVRKKARDERNAARRVLWESGLIDPPAKRKRRKRKNRRKHKTLAH